MHCRRSAGGPADDWKENTMIRAFAGAGGKTAMIKEYAQRFRDEGRTVLICTSTRMYKEDDTVITDDADEITEGLRTGRILMAGTDCGEKIGPLSMDTYYRVSSAADETLIEADGSKHLPLKMPAEFEPVIYDNVDEVIIVYGLHSLGMKAEEAVHRFELAEERGIMRRGDVICAEDITRIIRAGYMEKNFMDIKVSLRGAGYRNLYERALASVIDSGLSPEILDKRWFDGKPLLAVCGGGHISQQIVKIASCLDFRIRVIDDREEFADRKRFPLADDVICDSFDNLEKHMEDGAYYVIVTRGHRDDRLCLEKIIRTDASYIGMIGSRAKVSGTFELMEKAGFSKDELDRVHAPVGLEIGASTPSEIAVSILAEIILEKNKESFSSASGELLMSKEEGVLCIISGKTGSSPRGVGSMMLVTENGIIDSIGGGALEAQVIEDARKCTEACEKVYSLESGGSLGMICGGTNRVLIIPLKRRI